MEKFTLAIKRHRGTWFGVLMGDQNGLFASSFSSKKTKLEKHLVCDVPQVPSHESTRASDLALSDMMALYDGKRTTNTIRLSLQDVSTFQRNVCRLMKEIPRGRVTTYGAIAKKIETGPRAVGTAVARNPWPLFVPCHRVVPSNLEIGNYSISGGLSDYGCEVKRDLLTREHVPIVDDRIRSEAVWLPSEA